MTTLLPSLALSSKEASAMSFYEINAPQPTVAARFRTQIGQKLRNAFNTMQYVRMVQALSRLSNQELTAIGLERADIPDFAHRSIFRT